MAVSGMIDPSAIEAHVRLLELLARRVGDGRSDSGAGLLAAVMARTPGDCAWLAATLATLLTEQAVNTRIGAARLIRENAPELRTRVCPRELAPLAAALVEACTDESVNEYECEYGGFQCDELDIVVVADEARSALRALLADGTEAPAPGLIHPPAAEVNVRLLARRVGDGRADADSEVLAAVMARTPGDCARLAATLATLLTDQDVNTRIGAARLIRENATNLREFVGPGDFEQLKAALTRACEDKSANDYPYSGFQADELDLVTVADEVQLALRALKSARQSRQVA